MKTALLILAVLLLATNGFWLYRTLDNGITSTYREVSLRENQEALAQALQIIRVSRPTATREEVIEAAQTSHESSRPFEKEGYLWTGRLGLRFSEDGKLVEAVPAWK